MHRTSLAVAAFVLCLQPAAAAEKAAFIDGIYATEENCDKAKAIASKKKAPNVETYPDTLEAEGFKSWESSCIFTKVFEHTAGESWIALALCNEGPTFVPQTFAFVKAPDGSIESTEAGESEATVYKRCDTPPFRAE